MKHLKWKKYTAAVLCAVTAATAGPGLATVHADATGTPYVSLGADLDAGQRASVLELLGVSEADLEQYTVVTVTNEEEYEYLGDYLDADVIGDQAISSALVVGREEGHGIQVTTQNVTYCTVGMYQNALATAGLKNADVTVAGPVKVTGTAALIGVMKAYSEMTGTPVEATKIDAATDELITTGDLGQSLGDTEQAENLVAAVKEAVVAEDISDPDRISQLIDSAAEGLGIHLTEEEKQQIIELMQKIAGLDINVDDLKSQVQAIYDKLANMDLNITEEDVQGFFETIGNWFGSLWDRISSWLGGLFG